MNILPISYYNSNPNFGITSKVRIPMNDGTTTLLNVTGNVKKNGSILITRICGDIMKKGKSVGKTKDYANKQGFDIQRLAEITDELSIGAKEPDTVIDKIFEAVNNPSVDFNA